MGGRRVVCENGGEGDAWLATASDRDRVRMTVQRWRKREGRFFVPIPRTRDGTQDDKRQSKKHIPGCRSRGGRTGGCECEGSGFAQGLKEFSGGVSFGIGVAFSRGRVELFEHDV